MYENGSLVELKERKTHGDGEHEMRLDARSCGMVVHAERIKDGNHKYIVDFGPYGQWHCRHNELTGDDREGWDAEPNIRQDRPADDWTRITLAPSRPPVILSEDPHITDDVEGEEIPEEIDFERDMRRKEEEIEKEWNNVH